MGLKRLVHFKGIEMKVERVTKFGRDLKPTNSQTYQLYKRKSSLLFYKIVHKFTSF